MNSCGQMRSADGGVFTSPRIMNAQMADSLITGSIFRGGDIERLGTIDAASTEVIVKALAALPAESLKPLVDALVAALSFKQEAPATEPVAGESLPTTVRGDRSALLGEPASWLTMQEGLRVPAYK